MNWCRALKENLNTCHPVRTDVEPQEDRQRKKLEEEALGPTFEDAVESSSQREALGSLQARRRRPGSVPSSRAPQQATGVQRRNLLAPRGGGGRAQQQEQVPSGGLEIYVDDNVDGPSNAGAPAAGWERLPTQAQTRKENQQAASQWNGVKAQQRRSLVRPAQELPFIDIHVDEDLAEVEEQSDKLNQVTQAPLLPIQQQSGSFSARAEVTATTCSTVCSGKACTGRPDAKAAAGEHGTGGSFVP